MDCCPVSVRPATATDAPIIAQFLRDMLQELASMGDHPVSRDQEQWARIVSETEESLDKTAILHLLAETVAPPPTLVGWAYARTIDCEPVYEPARVLHISAVYVSQPYRRKGLGWTLLEALLQWGRDSACVEVELNVLVNNPARALYKGLGFSASHIKMVRKL